MTEQSRIPLPGEGGQPGKSLFERAEDAFGLDGLKAAPMPRTLAEPANRRVTRKEASPEGSRLGSALAAQFRGAVQPIDRRGLEERGLIVPDGGATGLLEEFRIIKRQVLLATRDARGAGQGEAAQRVLVSSPLPGEGKTFCAVNLALAIAVEKDTEVVLADADFAKPSIPALLGLAGETGLMDALADPGLPIERCVIPTDVPGLFVLPAGNRTSSDSEYLASGRTGEVLDRLTAGAPNRVVIFDSPPALAASPAAELARHVGQTLVVCRADQTGQSALEDALSLLSVCADLKLLLNDAHFSPSGRRFGSYGYGAHGE
jgi:Mrp family chromosome partitioning ATPase